MTTFNRRLDNMMNQCALKPAKQRRIFSKTLAFSLTLVTAASLIGCSKKQTAVSAQPADPPAPAVQQPVTAPPQGAHPTTVQANGQPDIAELNRALIRWIVRNRRPPANFQDFAATASVDIPPPPAGKKYVIAPNMHIQLVNQ